MKFWHSVFALSLRRRLSRMPAAAWTPGRVLRILSAQVVVQPSGLVVLPLAMFFMVPFGWCYAFYHNASLTCADQEGRLRDMVGTAWRQAMRWP